MTAPPGRFDHLIALTDRFGTFEHAEGSRPRREHGYCADDVARVLVVAAREPAPEPPVRALAASSLAFIRASLGARGDSRNRRAADGCWTSRGSVKDSWGRSLWGLGTAAANTDLNLGAEALALFERGATRRTTSPRSMAFASLGAAAVFDVDPTNRRALDLLEFNATLMSLPRAPASGWPWPEVRLAYANAVLPDAMMAVGTALGRDDLVRRGLDLLEWLLERETLDGHLSVTAVGGAGPGDRGPRFDQQPIEASSLADACARALTLDASTVWWRGIAMANAWFDGENDSQIAVWDPTTGGGYDGLLQSTVNVNQGAESTLALVSTRQQFARHCSVGV